MSHRCFIVLLGVLFLAPVSLAQDIALPASPAALPETGSRATAIRVSDRVILARDERMRQAHFTLVVHAGCLDEEPNCRGIAHYLEHLLLVGRDPRSEEHTS